MTKQFIITANKLVDTRVAHTCYKCNELLAPGTRVRSITGYVNDQFGKAYATRYACKKHRIKVYCGKKVMYG